MKNIGKVSLLLLMVTLLSSCDSDTKNTNSNTDTDSTLSASGEILDMDSSNEGGGNDSVDLLNDSFR